MEKGPRLGLQGVRDVLNDRCSEKRWAVGIEGSSLECSFVWKCTIGFSESRILSLKKCKLPFEKRTYNNNFCNTNLKI